MEPLLALTMTMDLRKRCLPMSAKTIHSQSAIVCDLGAQAGLIMKYRLGAFGTAALFSLFGAVPIAHADGNIQSFFAALDSAQILQLGSVYSPDILGAANRACAQRASGKDVTAINASVGQDLRARGLNWVTDDVAGGIVSIAFTQLCPR